MDEFMRMFRDEDRPCSRCGSNDDVQAWYSFGVYAGRLCHDCAMKYRDHCGLDGAQGDWRDLDEPYWEEG